MGIGSKLELKVPPVLLVIIFVAIMWMVADWVPQVQMVIPYKEIVLYGMLGLGFVFSILGVASFRKAKTTVNPTKPKESSSLVQTGIYRYTRNPMYVGFLMVLVGCALYLENVLSLLFCLLFIWYMNQFQIKPEERFLKTLFADEFVSYKKKVRRWL